MSASSPAATEVAVNRAVERYLEGFDQWSQMMIDSDYKVGLLQFSSRYRFSHNSPILLLDSSSTNTSPSEETLVIRSKLIKEEEKKNVQRHLILLYKMLECIIC